MEFDAMGIAELNSGERFIPKSVEVASGQRASAADRARRGPQARTLLLAGAMSRRPEWGAPNSRPQVDNPVLYYRAIKE